MCVPVITTTYVAFICPGEVYYEEVSTRNLERDAGRFSFSVFALFYFDVVTAVVDVAGESVGTASPPRNVSKTYFDAAELTCE